MAIIIGDSGVNRALKEVYIGDNGVNRKQNEIYVGEGGVNRKILTGEYLLDNPNQGVTYYPNTAINTELSFEINGSNDMQHAYFYMGDGRVLDFMLNSDFDEGAGALYTYVTIDYNGSQLFHNSFRGLAKRIRLLKNGSNITLWLGTISFGAQILDGSSIVSSFVSNINTFGFLVIK